VQGRYTGHVLENYIVNLTLEKLISLLSVEAPIPVTNSITPTGEIFPNHTQWSLRFDKEVSIVFVSIHCINSVVVLTTRVGHIGDSTITVEQANIYIMQFIAPSRPSIPR